MVQLSDPDKRSSPIRALRSLTPAQVEAAVGEMEHLPRGWVLVSEESYDGDLSLELRSPDPTADRTIVIFRDARGVHVAALIADSWRMQGIFPELDQALAVACQVAASMDRAPVGSAPAAA